jgi:SAM-dependent methyltransferase
MLELIGQLLVGFRNSYEDSARAAAYARLGFSDTYYLAYRELPAIIRNHVVGHRAVDFGCGSGRSTRFLRGLGFQITGIDISAEMVDKARQLDPDGDYRLVADRDYTSLGASCYDLVHSVFTSDNIPGRERRTILLRNLGSWLKEEGRGVMLDSTPELYGRD